MKTSRVFLIIAAVLLTIGVLLFLVGMIGGGFAFDRLSLTAAYEEKHLSRMSNAYTEIIFTDVNASITVLPVAGEEMRITYYESDSDMFQVEETDGRFSMQRTYKWSIKNLFQFFSLPKDLSVTIELPERYAGSLTIKTNNGSISAQALFHIEHLSLKTNNGKIELTDLAVTGAYEGHTSNGKVTAQNIRANAFSQTTSNGIITASQLSIVETLSLQTSNGRIELSDSTAGEISCSTSNSGIEIQNIFAPLIELKTSNGAIKGNISASMDDYKIESKTANGKNSLPTKKESGAYLLTAKTSNGSIDVTFRP